MVPINTKPTILRPLPILLLFCMLMPTLAKSAVIRDARFVKSAIENDTSTDSASVSSNGFIQRNPLTHSQSIYIKGSLQSKSSLGNKPISKNGISVANPSALDHWYHQKLEDDNASMKILTYWGLVSTIGGGMLMFGDQNDFGLMTASWGIINAALGINALYFTQNQEHTYEDILRDEILFNRIIAINSALNVSYILGGIALNHLNDSPRLNSYGNAIIIQGAFLLVFDSILLLNSSRRLNRLISLKEAVTIAPSPIKTPFDKNLNYRNLGISVKFNL